MKVLVCALEESANVHLKEILKHSIDLEIFGIYSQSIYSKKPLYHSNDFAIMGFVDVFKKIFFARKALNDLVFLAKDMDKILLIDAPSFNLRLAKKLKQKYPDKEIIYYILPKVWIWKKRRVKEIEKYCDKALSIFPFEDRFFNNSIYVGNPTIDEIPKNSSSINKDAITFMAGSRKSEIQSLINIFRDTAKDIKEEKILVIPESLKEDIDSIYGDISDFTISFNSYESLSRSKFAYICSGTATLESALIGTPFVLVYIAKPFDFFIAKNFINPKFIGLANIILDFYNIPALHGELIQDSVTKENLLNELKTINLKKFNESKAKLLDILKSGSSKNVSTILKGNTIVL